MGVLAICTLRPKKSAPVIMLTRSSVSFHVHKIRSYRLQTISALSEIEGESEVLSQILVLA